MKFRCIYWLKVDLAQYDRGEIYELSDEDVDYISERVYNFSLYFEPLEEGEVR